MPNPNLKARTSNSTFEATGDEFKGVLLALVAWREARGEGRTPAEKLESMRAVMHVIRNRVAAGWGDWDHVITRRNQFSAMSVPGDSQLVVWPDEDAPLFLAVLGLANAVYYGEDADPTGGALYYANIRHAGQPWFSEWFRRDILGNPEKHPETARIRNHAFFA
jgi:hypothetical protein